MLLADLVATSAAVAATRSRLRKAEAIAELLAGAGTDPELATAVAYLSGYLPGGRVGIGYAALDAARPVGAAPGPALTLADVEATLQEVAAITGSGSAEARVERLATLFERATDPEQGFLSRLLLGDLRQGSLAGVMTDAIARAFGVPAGAVRRAAMLGGDLAAVAVAARSGGEEALAAFRVEVLRPVQPMLAQTGEDVAAAVTATGPASVEWKLDGARIQVHKADDTVRVFSRRLNDVTAAVPEVVERIGRAAPASLVLDGEVIALGADGRPLAFQVTMSRFGRRLDVGAMRVEVPLTPLFFDCLYLDGDDLVDLPAAERFARLAAALEPDLVIPRIETADPSEAEDFAAAALDAGHEGVMVKALDAPYQAGARGKAWLKVKPVHTLDLVVLAAEWGSGRRQGWLSNLHLGARDPDGGFVMLGKTFKGMTDEILAWQTERLQEIEVSRDRRTVYVRPELVVEVAFNDVQASPTYPGGYALRFARIKGYRPDKGPADADTIDEIRRIYDAQG